MEVTTNTKDMVATMSTPNPRELASIMLMEKRRDTMNSKVTKRITTKEIMRGMVNTTATTMEMDTTNTRNMVTMLEHLDSTDMDKCMATTHCMDTTVVVTDTTEAIMDIMLEDTTVVVDTTEEVMATMVITAVIMATMDTTRLI